eukprot:3507412-Rhodomonas_salina.2
MFWCDGWERCVGCDAERRQARLGARTRLIPVERLHACLAGCLAVWRSGRLFLDPRLCVCAPVRRSLWLAARGTNLRPLREGTDSQWRRRRIQQALAFAPTTPRASGLAARKARVADPRQAVRAPGRATLGRPAAPMTDTEHCGAGPFGRCRCCFTPGHLSPSRERSGLQGCSLQLRVQGREPHSFRHRRQPESPRPPRRRWLNWLSCSPLAR